MHSERPKLAWQVIIVIVLALALVTMWSARPALTQSGGDASGLPSTTYDLSWNTIDGGGSTFSTGGGYVLGGTAGQPDAGVLTGSGYTLGGGFWGGEAVRYRIYLPLVMRQSS